MATHPPSLYLGFVSATVPFAFGIAALITGNLDDSWLASTRRWVLVSWYFLAQGLVLGSLWAYEELGWGGYWGWDPVENAGFLPWLTSTAFLHSIMVQERRGMMKVWNVSLVIITFLLTMIGTFMTRSGVVQSVHAFGQDTELAIIFLCFISFVIIFSFGYVIYRLPLLRGRNDLDSWLSREFVFLLNNWILLSAAFFILFATLFPTLSEWIVGERITVGPPFFIQWMTPIGLMLLFLTGVGPLIAWRKASRENLREQFTFPTIALVCTIGLLQLVPELRGWSSWIVGQKWTILSGHGIPINIPITSMVICFGFSAFTLTTIFQEFLRGTWVRQANTKLDFFTSLVGLVGRNKRRYGGYIVHVAIVLMFIGFAGDGYKRETEATLQPGKTMTLGKYTVRFDGLQRTVDPQKEMITATATVLVDDKEVYVLHPAKWFYKHHEDEPPTTEVDIHKTLKEDVYLILNGFEGKGTMGPDTLANIKLVINPLVNWIWLGFVLLAIGTVIAYLPERAYVLAGKLPIPEKTTAATALLILLWLGGPALADGMGVGMEAAGNELHIARSDRERAIFHQLKCLCNCMHSLNECGGECGPGARRRLEVQKLIDEGKADQQILDWELGRYGQEVLRIPPDHGFNRLAWVLPIAGLFAAAGGLIYAGRRWVKKAAPVVAEPVKADDDDYQDKLDDELDKLS